MWCFSPKKTQNRCPILFQNRFMCITSAVMWCFRPIREIYHLWTLAGGDALGELKKHDLIKTYPPVCNMPK